ncbi:killer cell lectin-like receptor subfamily G member 1 isoform X2 [Dendropsophus ebraccatus]|uniref:killer cell lectin-like receptor subfamily G member 1 isoform X2 n=1 Tax=Dendropsophus ebraccatus TaxID=150705 RepID=UPI003831D9CC
MSKDRASSVESGFLTEPSSVRTTPNGTLESLYESEENLKTVCADPRKIPCRFRLESVSVDNVTDPQLTLRSQITQIYYPSTPHIPDFYLKRNEKTCTEITEAEAERAASPERQTFIPNSRESEDNDGKKKKSRCQRTVKVPLWLIYLSIIIIIIITAILLGFLIPRGPVEDLASGRPPCEESWIWVGGRCYYFSGERKTWNQSQEFCSRHGSTLAILMDRSIEKTIRRYRETVNYWIGLHMNDEGQWMWVNGSLYDGSVENQGNQLRCAFLNSHLGALHCSTGRQWICVKDVT